MFIFITAINELHCHVEWIAYCIGRRLSTVACRLHSDCRPSPTVDHGVSCPTPTVDHDISSSLRLSTMVCRPHSNCRPWRVVLSPTVDHDISSSPRLSTMVCRLHSGYRPWSPLRLTTMVCRPHSCCRPWRVVPSPAVPTPTVSRGVSSALQLSPL
jgi:hypothetical protein